MGELYRADLWLWSAQQGRALRDAAREGNNAPVDWLNVAEEIESLGRSERRTLASQIGTVIEHLMKLQISPASRPRHGWIKTILRARNDIETVLDESPSLRREVPEIIARQAARMAKLVEFDLEKRGESVRTELASLAFTEDQVLGPWLPPDRPA
jgi:hypothetical protein